MAETSREALSNVNERNMNMTGLEHEEHWPGIDASKIDVPGMVNEISDLVLDDYSILQKTQFYIDMMQKIEDALANYENNAAASGEEVDKDCSLVSRALILAIETTKEIYRLYAFVQCCYQLRSVNLNSNIHCPMDYIQVVKKIGNETDLTSVDLEGLLPEVELLSVSLGVFTSFAKPLPQHILNKTIHACDRAISLHFALKKIFQFVTIVMGPDLATSAERDIAGGLRRVTPEITLASASAPPPRHAIDKKTIIKNMSYAARQRAYNQIRRSREALLL